MRKNAVQAERRAEFIRLAINDNKAASAIVAKLSLRLKKAKTTTQTVAILTDLLYLSEVTIFRDIRDV